MILKKMHAILICFTLTLFVFGIHILPTNNTMINYTSTDASNRFQIEDEFINWAVNYHSTNLEFKKRQLTTFLIKIVSKSLNVRLSVAFCVVNFTFLLLSGMMLFYLSLLYKLSINEAIVSIVFFYLSFSVLFAYFIPIATYDEPIQYFMVIVSFFFLKRKKFFFFILSISIAVISRETTLLLFPSLFFFVLNDYKSILKERKKLLLSFIYLGLPVIIYFFYVYWFYGQNQDIIVESSHILTEKFLTYKRNFQDTNYTLQSLLSLFSVVFLPLFIIYHRRKIIPDYMKKAWILTFVINTTLIIIAVNAEESRVFYLPFLLILPLMGRLIKEMIKLKKSDLLAMLAPFNLFIIITTVIGSWLIFTKLYELTDLNMNQNLYIEYNTLSVLFVVLVLLKYRNNKRSLLFNSYNSR